MRMQRSLIYDISGEELKNVVVELGESSFRADQILDGVYIKRARAFSEIMNIPKGLRIKLDERFIVDPLTVKDISSSTDGTQKILFELQDDHHIESVVIPERDDRYTLCLSTQAGCMLDCAFCATGKLKFGRNLQAAEIIAQLIDSERITGKKITNIVYMGMGEPLLNYEETIKSLNILTEGKTKLIGKKRITLSTVGVLPEMVRFRNDNPGVKLALSLHATTDEQRQKIIPIARKYKLRDLLDELELFYKKFRDPITFEYILFNDFNDSDEDVKRLSKICRAFPSKVNIIPYHQSNIKTGSIDLKSTRKMEIERFSNKLRSSGTNVFVRDSSGLDINAACGQLALSVQNNDT
jgi:23S rRNA (adenine2503-C2)-methyltransferase